MSSFSSSSTSLHRLRDLTDDDYSGDDLYDDVVERGDGHHHVPTSAAGGCYTDRDDHGSAFRPWRGRLSSQRDAAAAPPPPGPAGAALLPSPSSSSTHSRGSSEMTLSDDDDRQAPSSSAPPPPPLRPRLPHPAPSAAPVLSAAQQQHVVAAHSPPAPQREFICKECGKSYPTNQGLGGHKAGHRNKEREAAAAAARAAGGAPPQQDGGSARRRGRKEGPHVCGNCGKEFERGVQLGGHQRAHYKGPPIKPARRNKRRRLEPQPGGVVAVAEDNVNVVVAPPTPVIVAPAAPPPVRSSEEEMTPSPPAAAAANVRPVLLFGTDISTTHTQVDQPSSEQQDSRPASTADRG